MIRHDYLSSSYHIRTKVAALLLNFDIVVFNLQMQVQSCQYYMR